MADIFVSYASPDRDVAFRIVGFLEEQGITCWVAPRDVPPGVEYGQAIIDGIEQSRALVLILSDQSNDSMFVKKEVERAVSKTKPVLPVRIREVTPSGSLEFFISSAQSRRSDNRGRRPCARPRCRHRAAPTHARSQASVSCSSRRSPPAAGTR